MDVYRTIVSKRDTRAYQDRPVTEAVLRRIVNAGRMAGSSKNSQPCRFVVLREREGIRRLAECGQFTAAMAGAPLVVAILLQEGGRPFDAGRAAQNMMLAGWAEGITSCPIGIQDGECGRRALGAPPGYEVAMALTFGYPAPGTPLSRGNPRLPLEEVVHWERWRTEEART